MWLGLPVFAQTSVASRQVAGLPGASMLGTRITLAQAARLCTRNQVDFVSFRYNGSSDFTVVLAMPAVIMADTYNDTVAQPQTKAYLQPCTLSLGPPKIVSCVKDDGTTCPIP